MKKCTVYLIKYGIISVSQSPLIRNVAKLEGKNWQLFLGKKQICQLLNLG
jgi:hypothetical protein